MKHSDIKPPQVSTNNKQKLAAAFDPKKKSGKGKDGPGGQSGGKDAKAGAGAIVINTAMEYKPMSKEEIEELKSNIENKLTMEQRKGIYPIVKEEIVKQQESHKNSGTRYEF